MFWLLLILVKPDESNKLGIIGNPLAQYHTCGGNNNFEMATRDGNQYNLNIVEQNRTQSQINHLTFYSNATVILVFETIVRSEFDVNTLNNDVALLKLKSEAVFGDYVQPNCLRETSNYKKLPSNDVFGKEAGLRFNYKDVLLSKLQQMSIHIVSELISLNSNPLFFHTKPVTDNYHRDTENSVCRGDSGSGMSIVSGWGVATTREVLPTRRCHWPAFWLVVCPWYGMQHCQSKIL